MLLSPQEMFRCAESCFVFYSDKTIRTFCMAVNAHATDRGDKPVWFFLKENISASFAPRTVIPQNC
jgi:hypothetical protein